MNKIKTGITKTQFFLFISNERFEVCTTFCFSIATTSIENITTFVSSRITVTFDKYTKAQNELSPTMYCNS